MPHQNLVQLLGRAGYLTVAFSSNPYLTRDSALGRDFDILVDSSRLTRSWPAATRPGLLRRAARSAVALARSARPWSAPSMPGVCQRLLGETEKLVQAVPALVRTVRAEYPDRPLFVFCNLMVTHDPYLFEAQDACFARPSGARGPDPLPRRFQHRFWFDLLGVEPMSDGVLERLRWSYAAAARYADRLAGRLVGLLDDGLAAESPDVIITADHGELLGEHGFFGHGRFLYEQLVHVPLLVRSPLLAAAERVERPVQTHWLWSLILERAGLLAQAKVPPWQGDLVRLDSADAAGPVYSLSEPWARLREISVALQAAVAFGKDVEGIRPKLFECHTQAVRQRDAALIRTESGRLRAFRLSGAFEEELRGADYETARGLLDPHLLDVDWGSAVPSAPANGAAGEHVMRRLRDLGYAD